MVGVWHENGSEFFTTQVLYDSSKIIKMISHYQKRCDEKNTFPRRLLLSFAPVSSEMITSALVRGERGRKLSIVMEGDAFQRAMEGAGRALNVPAGGGPTEPADSRGGDERVDARNWMAALPFMAPRTARRKALQQT